MHKTLKALDIVGKKIKVYLGQNAIIADLEAIHEDGLVLSSERGRGIVPLSLVNYIDFPNDPQVFVDAAKKAQEAKKQEAIRNELMNVGKK